MSNKKLEHYLSLNYEILLRRLERHGAFYFEARIAELDPLTFYGTGDTVDEAISDLEEVKREMFSYYIENGLPIATPAKVEQGLPSGKFVVRTSPRTHHNLVKNAKLNNQSLNAYVNAILERNCACVDTIQVLESWRSAVTLVGATTLESNYQFHEITALKPPDGKENRAKYKESA